ncbi:cytidine deaminase [Mangrovimonas aestuarii]|uniref:cytidine deaminase n=1 Tax=Mangrovimonas aestuarii TaxID=3018443 RepID=UPI002378E2AC|nr:cytidine deaminase [Mangrovimonas aestuarii]
MKTVEIKSVLIVYDNVDELPGDVSKLMSKAIEARQNAYAPYSKFSVGAAILLDNGEVVVGSNQENASFPSGLCAERTAIYAAGAQFPNAKVIKLAITAASQVRQTVAPVAPCGACRQAISEYEVKQGRPIDIYFMGETGKVVRSESLENLLPLVFDKSAL